MNMTHQTKLVVKKENTVKKQFLGVDFEVLAIGKESMVTKMLYKESDSVPFHKHPNEQNGYVITGQYKLIFDKKEYILSTGDSYSIPANMEHSLEIIIAGDVIDVFTPVRQDYL
jgi:quercetin dioxygenase-like cupin family protein